MKRYRLELSADYGRIELKNNISGKVEKFADFNTNGITLMALSCFYHGISMLDIEDPTPVFRCHPRPPRTKTFMEILNQFHRIAMGTGNHESLRHRAYNAYCVYRDNIMSSEKYDRARDHVINCINGKDRYGNSIGRSGLYPPIKMSKEDKLNLSSRIVDTTLGFTKEEYENAEYIQHFDND